LREDAPGAVGNVRPVLRPGDLVELPPSGDAREPYWQSYTLPIREPGQPHLVELEYPLSGEQSLAISLVEPDAAGRVTTTQQDASFFRKGLIHQKTGQAGENQLGVHRFVIWPRTRAPQLLLVNRHATAPAQYGKIKLLRQDDTAVAPPETPRSERLVAGYLAKPLLAENFGAAERLDPESGLSVQGWGTFLDATRRLVQLLELQGYNSVLLSVAADGSAIYPSQVLNPSPRYDTGALAASGQDPLRKDVLEMMLRIFDREGIRVIPTLELATPLPRLEELRANADSRLTGTECIGPAGVSWFAKQAAHDGKTAYYNPLNDRVQAELVSLVAELTDRYAAHASIAGIGIQLTGEGYGMLPGLAWGLDDQTMADFSRATGVVVPGAGADRFATRAGFLLGEQRQAWRNWRSAELTALYQQLAQQVTARRDDIDLILTTEQLFAGQVLEQRVRQAIADPAQFGEILLDHGIDFSQWSAQPQPLLTQRLSVGTRLQENAIDFRLNVAAEQGELLAAGAGEMVYSGSRRFRLPSFDRQSPFGSQQTFLTVSSQPQGAGGQGLTALARTDTALLVVGGTQLGLGLDRQSGGMLKALRQLPEVQADTKWQRAQPLVMRVYRTEQATVVALINEAPWPVEAQITLTGSAVSAWRKLGGDPTELLAGELAEGPQTWQVALKPYDLQAWQFQDGKLRVDEFKSVVSDLAKQELQQRIEAVESRVGNLNIERSYAQLQNPGFELEDGSLRIVGWQPRQGAVGSIALDRELPRSGKQALRLESSDATGVAVQSHLFPAPDTGQLTVGLFLRASHLDSASQLQISVQDASGGQRYHQRAVLDPTQLAGDAWTHYEFPLGDVPADTQLRLVFHLTGTAQVVLDDVQLYDLRFDDVRRRALVKRIYAAKLALDKGQWVDCLRVVDDYWSQYLVENVPPVEPVGLQASKQSPVAEPEVPEKAGLGSRLKGWVEPIWR
jgi:hypothetical protein